MRKMEAAEILESKGLDLSGVATHAPGPGGSLPLTAEMLLTEPSGNLFGLSQNVGMGWEPSRLLGPEVLILSTHGGLRADDGRRLRWGCTPATGRWACWWPRQRGS